MNAKEQNDNPNAPLVKEGDIAVFRHRHRPFVLVHGVEVPIYNVSVGKRDKRTYLEVYGNVAGRRLEPEMVLELMKGEAIELDFPSQSGGTYIASLVNGGVKTEEFTNQQTGVKRTTAKLNTVKIGHLCNRDGEHFGYKVPTADRRHIEVQKYIRSSTFPDGPSIELDARDCYTLVQGGKGTQIQTEFGTVQMMGTSDKEVTTAKGVVVYTHAKLGIRYNAQIAQELKAQKTQKEGSIDDNSGQEEAQRIKA
jgi:hypothetical protein